MPPAMILTQRSSAASLGSIEFTGDANDAHSVGDQVVLAWGRGRRQQCTEFAARKAPLPPGLQRLRQSVPRKSASARRTMRARLRWCP